MDIGPFMGAFSPDPRPLNLKFMSCVLSGLWYSQLMAKFLLLPILFMAFAAVYFYNGKKINSFFYTHRKPITVIGLAGLIGLVLVYILFGINFSIFSA